MKGLKITFATIGIVIILFFLVAAVLPSTYTVTRSIEINRPVGPIYAMVSDLTQWPAWSPWKAMDPDAEMIFEGMEGQPGSSWAWNGDVLGQGKLTLKQTDPNHKARFELEFYTPNKMVADDIWTFTSLPSQQSTRVTWTNTGPLDYPVGRYIGLFMDQMMGPDFEKGLTNLKNFAEKGAMSESSTMK